jgi:hypothetical protein
MISSELDAEPDRPEDGSRCQVHGNTVLTEGKYAKKGKNATIAQHYETDKPYIQWVRTHIHSNSSMEMQKLRVYIFQRDAMKKERIHRDRFLVLWHGWRRRGRKELDGDGDDVRRRVLSDQFSTEHGLESCQQWPEAPGESPQARHARQSCSRSGQRW